MFAVPPDILNVEESPLPVTVSVPFEKFTV